MRSHHRLGDMLASWAKRGAELPPAGFATDCHRDRALRNCSHQKLKAVPRLPGDLYSCTVSDPLAHHGRAHRLHDWTVIPSMFEPGERRGFASATDTETPGWTAVGISAGEPIDLSGVDPWANATADWTATQKWIVASHPAYPTQRTRADVYTIRASDGRSVKFAAAELSNGVWGFYLPTVRP